MENSSSKTSATMLHTCVTVFRKNGSECAQCAVGPERLKDFLQDVFQKIAPHIKGFDIEFEEISS